MKNSLLLLSIKWLWLLSMIATGNAQNGSESDAGLKFGENFKQMLTESSSELDLLNDSAEVVDDESKTGGLKFDDFVSQKELKSSIGFGPKLNDSLMNVFKVPKSKNKKTISTIKHSSIKNDAVLNDFNSESLFSFSDGNLSSYDTYFHAFQHLFDHSRWNPNAFRTDISKECFKDVQIYLNALSLSKDWAIKVSDASGRYRGMYFFDNFYWLGSKEFCEEIDRENKENDAVPELKFFVVNFLAFLEPVNHKQPKLLDLGQCLPKSCSTQDVTAIISRDPASMVLQQMLTPNNTKANELKILQTRVVPGDYSLLDDHKFYVFGVFVITLLLLVICASIYEESLTAKGVNLYENDDHEIEKKKKAAAIHCENNNNNNKYELNYMNNNNNEPDYEMSTKVHKEKDSLDFLSRLLLCFSYQSNSRVLLGTKSSAEDSLTCIHGLRFFTLLWTILVHTYLQMFGIGENRFTRNITERTFIYQIVGNATYSVDTFFFISGLLVVLLFLRGEKSKRAKNCSGIEETQNKQPSDGFLVNSFWKSLMMIFYRFVRLTPAYFFIMVFTELGLKITYNQSVFTPGLYDHVTCNKFFWRNLLYVQNFYPLSEMCMMWSWYLANDFQFYVITIVLLLISTRYLKFSILSAFVITFFSWIVTIYLSIQYKYMHKVAEPFESFDFLYDKPWQRFGPYFMGMVAGYILYRVKVPPKVPFIINVGLWAASLFTLLIIIFGVQEGKLSVISTSFYVSLGHTAWGLALIWITLSCCWGLAKPINSLLSFPGFYPLSRLTYCTYLIHPTVMMFTSFQSESPAHLRHGLILTTFFGNAVISFLLAFIISLLVEAPVIRLLKVLLKKIKILEHR